MNLVFVLIVNENKSHEGKSKRMRWFNLQEITSWNEFLHQTYVKLMYDYLFSRICVFRTT